MGSSDRVRGGPPGASDPLSNDPVAPAVPPIADPYSNWLDRVQRGRGRHAAITRNLYSWSNYKSWADRVKNNWDDGKKK